MPLFMSSATVSSGEQEDPRYDVAMAAVRKHTWYARVPISGPPAGPNNLAWFDSALGVLKDTGLPEAAKVGVVMGLITYVQGEIQMAFDLAAGYAENPDSFQ